MKRFDPTLVHQIGVDPEPIMIPDNNGGFVLYDDAEQIVKAFGLLLLSDRYYRIAEQYHIGTDDYAAATVTARKSKAEAIAIYNSIMHKEK